MSEVFVGGKMEELKIEICKLLEELSEGGINAEVQYTEDKILEDSIDSIVYIEFIVEIEERYGFEFDDDKLEISQFESITELAKYITMKGDLQSE